MGGDERSVKLARESKQRGRKKANEGMEKEIASCSQAVHVQLDY